MNKTEMREKYLEDEITHSEYYLWLAKQYGIGYQHIPYQFTNERVKTALKDGDSHLNTLELAIWDKAISIPNGLSLSDCVCMLKELARKRAEDE